MASPPKVPRVNIHALWHGQPKNLTPPLTKRQKRTKMLMTGSLRGKPAAASQPLAAMVAAEQAWPDIMPTRKKADSSVR